MFFKKRKASDEETFFNIWRPLKTQQPSQVALAIKNLHANADLREMGLIPGLGRSPARVMAAHSSILAWKTPWTEEPSGLQSRVRHNSSNLSAAQNSIKAYKKLVIKIATTMDLSDASVVKALHSMHEVWVWSLDREQVDHVTQQKKKKKVCMQNSYKLLVRMQNGITTLLDFSSFFKSWKKSKRAPANLNNSKNTQQGRNDWYMQHTISEYAKR